MAVNKRRVDAKPQPRQKPGKHPLLRFPAHYSRQNATKREKEKSFGSKSSEGGLERAETRAEGGGVWRDYKGVFVCEEKSWLENEG